MSDEAEARKQRLRDAADDDTPSSDTALRLAAMRKRRFKKKGTAAEVMTEAADPDAVPSDVEGVMLQEAALDVISDNVVEDFERFESSEDLARQLADVRMQKILEAANDRIDKVTGLHRDEADASAAQAKIAAMRKRRFKTKEKSHDDGGAVDSVTDTGAAATTREDIVDVDTENTSANDDDDGEPRKYKGVARMRRQMLKDRQNKNQVDLSQATSKPKRRSLATTLPILMHALTAIMLFLAGLDVGLQNPKSIFCKIHIDLSPKQQGLLLWPFNNNKQSKTGDDDNETLGNKPKGALAASSQYMLDGTIIAEDELDGTIIAEDEFADSIADGKSTLPENLDPLFGVDLDRMTAGPGIFNMATRVAVAAHRVNLSLFYYGPLYLWERIVGLASQLFLTPPILMLVALMIRQVIGKKLLGAKLPDTRIEQQKDIVSMIKNFVVNIILKSFPTGASLYDAWIHLRTDMYIVMFGLLVGLTYNYAQPTVGVGASIDEHVKSIHQAAPHDVMETIPEEISDEL